MPEAASPKHDLTIDEMRAQLEFRERSIENHLVGLKKELTTFNDVNVGGRPLLDYVREDPLLAVGVAAGVGLVAGLLGGLLAREEPEEPSERDLWMSAYLDDLVDEAGGRVAGGEDAEAALGHVLRHRAPVIVLEEDREAHATSHTLNVLVNTALGFGAKFALDRIAQQLTGEDEIVEALDAAPDPPPISPANPYSPA